MRLLCFLKLLDVTKLTLFKYRSKRSVIKEAAECLQSLIKVLE